MRDEDMAALYYFGKAVDLDLADLEARLASLPQVEKAAVSQQVHDETIIAVSGCDAIDPNELGDVIEELIQTMQAEKLERKKRIVVLGAGPVAMQAALRALEGRGDVVICDGKSMPELVDFKAPPNHQLERYIEALDELPYEDFDVTSAHLNYEERQKLMTKGCRSKRRRKW